MGTHIFINEGRVVAKTLVHFIYSNAHNSELKKKNDRNVQSNFSISAKGCVLYIFQYIPLKIRCNSKMAAEQLLISALYFRMLFEIH